MELVLQWVTQYGYFGIFALLVLGIVGLPIPDETMLTFAGYLIYTGRLRPVPTIAAAILGSLCGITTSYVLGRTSGYFLLDKYGPKLRIKKEHVQLVHDWFHRIGRFTLTFGYFVPGVRHLTAYVAGASKLEFPLFALFAYSGGVVWSCTFLSLGYFLGDRWEQVSEDAHQYVLIAACVLALAGGAYWLRRRLRKKQTSSAK